MSEMLTMLTVGMTLFGFHVDSVTEVPDVGGRMWRMTYEKNGAELLWLERDDEVKSFTIAFKTLPTDDTGVAHILEHSVLSGSEKYPVKSPFNELRKSSVNVFINAMTSKDMTFYPFSTRNDADFLNLADVYLDAVFYPLVVKQPQAFYQEGWHYEWDRAKRELSVNGVVFNEMKGLYASPERHVYGEITSALYPDTVYGHDSGGNPASIPTLTYEAFCAFHKRFYHPSNARIFIDGSVPLEPLLAKLDGYLKDFEARELQTDVALQSPCEVKKRIPYASASCDNKVFYAEGWSAGDSYAPVYRHALEILSVYLCGSNEAPLTKALLEKNLCRDVSMVKVDYRQMPIYLVVKETSEAHVDAIRQTIRDTLTQLCDQGLDKNLLHAILNGNEFAERELNINYPKGLIFFSRLSSNWFFGANPAAPFALTEIYATLREGVDTGLFERLIREQLLDNPHHAEVVLYPDPTLAARQADAERQRLEAIRDAMSERELDALGEAAAQLKAYQQRKDDPANIAKIPRLTSRELAPKGAPVSSELHTEDEVVRIKTKTTADGIFHLSLYFPMDDLTADELVRMPLFADLLGKLKTANYSALALQTAITANIGEIEFAVISPARGRYFTVTLSALLEKKEATFALLKELLFKTSFEDQADIEAVLLQSRLSAEQVALMDGRDIAVRYAKRHLNERWMASDCLYGEGQLRWLQRASADTDLRQWYAALASRLFQMRGLVISHTDNLKDDAVNELLTAFGQESQVKQAIAPVPNEWQGFQIDGDTGFAGWVAPLPEGVVTTGAMHVATRMLTLEYLQNEVREIGGAYGVSMRVTASGMVECSTYRDPTPSRSLQIMNTLGDALRKMLSEEVDIDRYIVASIASMEPYRSPADEALLAISLFVENRDGDDLERVRREMLTTTKEQLLAFATLLDTITPTATTCIVGGQRQLNTLPTTKTQPIKP